ncbi:Lar family restriction alleviation protein [Enterobacter hormaechei]|uniref:Lar family restriction alleviation protein n=1 Tax=Enterobacter TaxID=547 RepID=UPI000907E8E8|nr:Lar family restriction alleviation protein [Enterobacter hormaechei]ELK4605707.1 Lar family restriction alleviation protein [Escherichia coli]MBT1858668.1 Lar family restriction alleviation protein [Enterobacter hormaechei subsp. xiangfangensis]MCF2450483.1 Lar family restriction alleviation protein [Enterobacter sp. MV-xx2-O]HCM9223909.1 Lar family restriction alleviation protein [Enterobacter bugandensis]HCM9628354.1 Lar family restriction alleviation protein [Enterobacter hormaechei subs
MSEEIKPCPFCGCKAEWMSHQFNGIDFCGYQIACTSPSCQATGRFSGQRQKALAAWNNRHGEKS